MEQYLPRRIYICKVARKQQIRKTNQHTRRAHTRPHAWWTQGTTKTRTKKPTHSTKLKSKNRTKVNSVFASHALEEKGRHTLNWYFLVGVRRLHRWWLAGMPIIYNSTIVLCVPGAPSPGHMMPSRRRRHREKRFRIQTSTTKFIFTISFRLRTYMPSPPQHRMHACIQLIEMPFFFFFYLLGKDDTVSILCNLRHFRVNASWQKHTLKRNYSLGMLGAGAAASSLSHQWRRDVNEGRNANWFERGKNVSAQENCEKTAMKEQAKWCHAAFCVVVLREKAILNASKDQCSMYSVIQYFSHGKFNFRLSLAHSLMHGINDRESVHSFSHTYVLEIALRANSIDGAIAMQSQR